VATASPSLVEVGRNDSATPAPPRASGDDDTTAWWTLDVSGARATVASIASGNGPANWIELLLAGISIADVDQNIVHLVGPYAGRRQMIGQPIIAYWPPESWSALAELIMAGVADYPSDAARTRKITSLAFADPVISIATDETGAHPDIVFLSIAGTVVDHRSLWSVRASETRYRNLIHHLPWALLQVDSTPMSVLFDTLRRDGLTDIRAHLEDMPDLASQCSKLVQVTDANQNAVQLFGVGGAESLIGSVDFLFAASPDTAKRVIAAHFDGHRNYAETMKLRTFDGRLRDVELSVTYPTPPERLDVTLLSLEDVTDRLRTEAQLRQLTADYSRAARISMLGELATSIAHEVNQPLSAIVTNAETSLRWLSRDDPNLAKVGQLTVRIAENARRASDIVQRIRGMAARRAPERVLLDLNGIVEEALLFVRHEIESRAIALSTRLASGLPPVLGDRVQLQQVIVNLLVNAVQAQHGEPGRIDLDTATGEDGSVVFTIHDSGHGIAEENLDRIFGSFFTTKDEGIGIGLALCQSIIAAHGGTISVSNHPEGGALFQFSLPAAVPEID
jgi:signal transduction histidine kinase